MMQIAIGSVAFVFAAACAALMGFAIQRGATCTVAAVDEIVGNGRFARLAAMVEASVWVAGGLALAQAWRGLPATPAGYPVTAATVLGGVLLGLGAYVNRACVFGAIARLGSGEWAYVMTPLGFYAGCVSVPYVFRLDTASPLAEGSPVLDAAPWLALPFIAFALFRVARGLAAAQADSSHGLAARLRDAVATRLWSPHAATTVIGVTFVAMLLAVGAWAYTDALAELARGMAGSLAARTLLLLALFGGAVAGGLTAGRFRRTRVSWRQLAQCFAGGALMGWGSLLIPGSNDGLTLVGMPLLWPYAWLAFAAMCVTIGAAIAIEQRVATKLARA
jgi:toxin CptA